MTFRQDHGIVITNFCLMVEITFYYTHLHYSIFMMLSIFVALPEQGG
ncbi:hypothetical protein GTPT_1002 [Tatumella ptyseos ATCC 33301]|uniref:Uncharacterized protein n=1 Tax=Tatumella ptyseos ATCC 33301 TaxID=1005995 RepID=A0A085JKR6_9GAMM|nr:hypothetical protein GTPT_1002 [Tatumella ptyseos ATCC 33301]